MKARVRPIISADAVAVVRRGLRSEFWPASWPDRPEERARRPRRSPAGTAGRSPGWPRSRPAARRARRRRPTSRCAGTAPTNSPTSGQRDADRDQRDAEQQPAAYGRLGQRHVVAQRLHRRDPAGPAGRQPGRHHRHDDPGGVRRDDRARRQDERLARRGRGRTSRRARGCPCASSTPRPRPSVEPTTPTTNASSWTERITCRLEAPSARSSASSRLRWATRIEKVLTMM